MNSSSGQAVVIEIVVSLPRNLATVKIYIKETWCTLPVQSYVCGHLTFMLA